MKWRCNVNRQKIIDNIKQDYLLKRFSAQERCEEFIENLRKNEEFNDVYLKITKKQIDLLKTSVEEEKQILKNDIESLRAKLNKFLENNNIDKSNLNPKYECKLCEDTGVYNGRMCDCLKEELNRRISALTSTQSNFKTFENINKNIMDETDLKLYELLKSWCEKYPNVSKINVNIMGGAGCGKTYLLECVANELIKKGAAVCYITAFELNEQARLYHIGKGYDFADSINAEVLLIDDLGTEPILKNVTKEYLYNLINIRQVNKKPTFITTNLSLENILSRYDERIFSRLGNKNLSINAMLTSGDKRLI